jgi:hypothetical protein
VLTFHAVERLSLVIQRNEVTGGQVLTKAIWDEQREPALRTRCAPFDVEPIGAGGRIEKNG